MLLPFVDLGGGGYGPACRQPWLAIVGVYPLINGGMQLSSP